MENIQVAVRIKPESEPSVWGIQESQLYLRNQELIRKLGQGSQRSVFAFDRCFSSTETNRQIYEPVKDMVRGSLNGMNATVFLYGQTGSGKTYTMLGREADEGILLQSLCDLFGEMEKDLNKSYVLRCSYVEIYNEQIFDLLKPSSKLSEVLTVAEDQKKEFFIKGVIEQSVSSLSEILETLKRGEVNRHYAQTAMNHHSSRSHAIFRLNVQSITNDFIRNYKREKSQQQFPTIDQIQYQSQGAGALLTESTLTFVDLAGSEKVSNHFVEEADEQRRIKEGQYINKSLFFLTQVIYMKAEDKQHVPFRNSSLTKILRSSLGGNSRTLIVLCIDSSPSAIEHTMSTLRFGVNAKKIETKVLANITNHNDDEALKLLISDYEKKTHDLESLRLEQKQQYESEINNLHNQINKLELRLTTYNKDKFQELKSIVPETTWASRFDNDLHIDSVGDLHRCNTRVVKPIKRKHECQCKIVLQALKQSESKNRDFITNFTLIKDQYNQLKLTYDKQSIVYKSLSEQYITVNAQYQQLISLAHNMKNKLSFDPQTLQDEILKQYHAFYQTNWSALHQELLSRGLIFEQKWHFDLTKYQIPDNVNQASVEQLQQVDLDTIFYKQNTKSNLNDSVSMNSLESESDQESFTLQFPKYEQQHKMSTLELVTQSMLQPSTSVNQSVAHSILNQSVITHDKFNVDQSVDLSESQFKTALKNFLTEVDNQVLIKKNSNSNIYSSGQKKQKYKTPDTKQKKLSSSQTSIRSKHNIENTQSMKVVNAIPKPQKKMDDLSRLLHNC